MKSIPQNLLIVEDNSFIGKKILNATKNISNIESVCLTESLLEASNLLEKNNFNFIILDLKLPDGSGLEILKTLKQKQIETKVFVFSISTELKHICLKYGATAFYDKAKDFDKLIEAIKKG